MAHIESYSLHPEKDKGLIEWLGSLQKSGQSKSDVSRKALYLYRDLSNVLDVQQLAENLQEFPDVVRAITRIEQSLEILSRIERKLDNVELRSPDSSGPETSNNRRAVLDLMNQIDGLDL